MKPVTMTGGYDGQPWVQPRQCYRTSSCHVGNDGTRRTVRGRSTGTLTCLTGLGGMLLARGGVGGLASFTRRLASSIQPTPAIAEPEHVDAARSHADGSIGRPADCSVVA